MILNIFGFWHQDYAKNERTLLGQGRRLLVFECDVSHAAQRRPLILRIEETEALRNLLLRSLLNKNLKTTEVFDVNQTAPLSYSLLKRMAGQ
jgi:hypothetical protein